MRYIFSKRARDTNPALISQMSAWANEIGGVNISLGQGIPSEELPRSLKVKLVEAINNQLEINRYTLKSGVPELKKSIIKDLKERKITANLSEKEIGITVGCIGALFSTILAILERGEEVLIFSPAYPPHIEIVKLAEGKAVFIPLIEKEYWRPDIQKLKNSITKKTKAIIICNPSNPTGLVFSREDLKEVIEVARRNNIFIISDETYDFLTYDGAVHHSLLSFPEAMDRGVACFSFSKRFFMTGFRVGFVVAKEEMLNQILKIHDQSSICAPSISQYAALFAFQENIRRDFENLHKGFAQKRKVTLERMNRLSRFFEYHPPCGSYYILPRIKFSNIKKKTNPAIKRQIQKKLELTKKELRTPDFEFSLELLYGAKALVIPGIIFGPQGRNHIRISFGGSLNQINDSFDKIENYLL